MRASLEAPRQGPPDGACRPLPQFARRRAACHAAAHQRLAVVLVAQGGAAIHHRPRGGHAAARHVVRGRGAQFVLAVGGDLESAQRGRHHALAGVQGLQSHHQRRASGNRTTEIRQLASILFGFRDLKSESGEKAQFLVKLAGSSSTSLVSRALPFAMAGSPAEHHSSSSPRQTQKPLLDVL